eukprot:scaffold165702_cov38-Prasinocladus_malaysianus.AAC.1
MQSTNCFRHKHLLATPLHTFAPGTQLPAILVSDGKVFACFSAVHSCPCRPQDRAVLDRCAVLYQPDWRPAKLQALLTPGAVRSRISRKRYICRAIAITFGCREAREKTDNIPCWWQV